MRFHGNVGFTNTVESSDGVWTEDIVEYPYFGDVLRNTRELQAVETLNDDVRVQNSISIVGDSQAFEHYFNIRYVWWQNVAWKVTDVEVKVDVPRLILRLGGVWNGPFGTTPGDSGDGSVL